MMQEKQALILSWEDPDYLTVREIAGMTGCSESKIREDIARGLLTFSPGMGKRLPHSKRVSPVVEAQPARKYANEYGRDRRKRDPAKNGKIRAKPYYSSTRMVDEEEGWRVTHRESQKIVFSGKMKKCLRYVSGADPITRKPRNRDDYLITREE